MNIAIPKAAFTARDGKWIALCREQCNWGHRVAIGIVPRRQISAFIGE